MIIKPTRPVYSEHLARVYGNFILNTCVVNNSVALLEEAAYFMVHEGTLDAANPERADRDSSSSSSRPTDTEASNQTTRTTQPTPGSGRFAASPIPTTIQSTLRVNLDERRLEGLHAGNARPTATLSASTAYAIAAIKKAAEKTMIFINRKTHCKESQSERCIRMELFLFFTEGLPRILSRDIPAGDICALFYRVMAVGQNNTMQTRRHLNSELASIKKGRDTWPIYLDRFEQLHDTIEATGVRHDDGYYITCLLEGLSGDQGDRYSEPIRQVEIAEPAMTLEEIIRKVGNFARQIKDDQLREEQKQTTQTAFVAEKGANAKRGEPVQFTGDVEKAAKQNCRNFKANKPCHHSPCPYSHDGKQPKLGGKPLAACWNLRDGKTCTHGTGCRFSHDDKIVNEARRAAKSAEGFLAVEGGEADYEEALLTEIIDTGIFRARSPSTSRNSDGFCMFDTTNARQSMPMGNEFAPVQYTANRTTNSTHNREQVSLNPALFEIWVGSQNATTVGDNYLPPLFPYDDGHATVDKATAPSNPAQERSEAMVGPTRSAHTGGDGPPDKPALCWPLDLLWPVPPGQTTLHWPLNLLWDCHCFRQHHCGMISLFESSFCHKCGPCYEAHATAPSLPSTGHCKCECPFITSAVNGLPPLTPGGIYYDGQIYDPRDYPDSGPRGRYLTRKRLRRGSVVLVHYNEPIHPGCFRLYPTNVEERCAYYNTPDGCVNANYCPFLHEDDLGTEVKVDLEVQSAATSPPESVDTSPPVWTPLGTTTAQLTSVQQEESEQMTGTAYSMTYAGDGPLQLYQNGAHHDNRSVRGPKPKSAAWRRRRIERRVAKRQRHPVYVKARSHRHTSQKRERGRYRQRQRDLPQTYPSTSRVLELHHTVYELDNAGAVYHQVIGELELSTLETATCCMADHNIATRSAACVDTGASAHCVPLNEHFTAAIIPGTSRACRVIINTAGAGETIIATQRADMLVQSPVTGHAPIVLREVLMAEKLRKGLVSVAVLTMEGYKIWFSTTKCHIMDPRGATCLEVDRRGSNSVSSLYEFPTTFFVTNHDKQETAMLASTHANNDAAIWHLRLAHCSASRLTELHKNIGVNAKDGQAQCIECTQAKIHHACYPKRASFQAEFPGQSFALDFAGPYRTRSPFGHRYMCLLVDVASRHITLVAATFKHELVTIVDSYIELVERVQQPRKVVTIVSDGALCQKDHLQRLREKGITVLIVAPGASRLNGKVERRIRTVTEGARAMNLSAGLPPTLFIPAAQYCATIQNFIPLRATTTAAKSVSGRPLCPLELWTRRDFGSWKLLLARFRVYGCLTFALQRSHDKQVNKSERAIMLGLAPNNLDAYFLMSLESKRYFVSRDVVCHESILPFKKQFELPAFVHSAPSSEDHGELDPNPVDEGQMDPALQNQQTNPPDVRVEEEVGAEDATEDAAADSALAPAEQSVPVPASIIDAPVATRVHGPSPAPNKRLSFSAALPASSFEERKALGTGDQDPGPRSSPARLNVGGRYNTISGDHIIVREVNSDGDVQVTFPNHPDEDPSELYTVSKEDILGTVEEAFLGENAPTSNVSTDTFNSFSWMAIESTEGELLTAHEFTARFQPRHEALSATTSSTVKLATDFRKMKELHGQNDSGTRRMPALGLGDLVGKVPAESVDVPRTHYQLKNSSVRPLVEDAQRIELETLIRKGVLQDAHSATDSDIVIPTMFVNRAKPDSNGMLAKIKARLTLRGDLDKADPASPRRTYAPVLIPSTLRLLLSLHCQDLSVNFHQMDLEAAFVTARPTRRIVVRLPPGYRGPGAPAPNAVHVLNYNLYGADDAPLVYMKDMMAKHSKLGFSTIFQDHCYLELHRGTHFIKMVFHVDDFCIAQRGQQLWDWYLHSLGALYTYSVTPLSYYLGMRFQRDATSGRFIIDQEGQVDKMIRAFGITDDKKLCLTPVLSFSETDRPLLADVPSSATDLAQASKYPYRQAVGHLNYLSQCSHLEVTLPTRIAAAFMSGWGAKHWTWVKNIMRYLKTKSSKNFIISGGPLTRELSAWSDSDHAGNPDNRKSMAAHIIFFGSDAIDWYAHTESIVAHSSAESELMALDACARQVQHFRWLLQSLKVTLTGPSNIHMDSSSAIGMAENPIQNRRNRHIHARYFYVRDLIDTNIIVLAKVDSDDNLADLLATYKDKATFVKLIQLCKPQE